MSGAPELIWARFTEDYGAVQIGQWADSIRIEPSGTEYIRADVSAARIADLERQLAEALAVGLKVALRNGDLTHQLAEAREVKPLEWEVKPLEWDDFDGVGAKASAFYQANYLIQKWSGEGRFEVSMSYPGYQTGYEGPRWHPTLEAAKTAAQADYTARILSAMKGPTP